MINKTFNQLNRGRSSLKTLSTQFFQDIEKKLLEDKSEEKKEALKTIVPLIK